MMLVRRYRAVVLLIFVIVASFFVFFFDLGRMPLYEDDESLYAIVAKNFASGGDWVTPHALRGERGTPEPWFDKPPLQMWMTASVYRLFGVSELTTRLVSALAAVGIMLLTFFIGRRLFSLFSAVIAVFILFTTQIVLFLGRFGFVDMLLVFFMYAALASYIFFEKRTRKHWYVTFGFIGLGIMTKGAAGIITPLLLLVFLLFRGRLLMTIKTRHFWGGIGLCALIVLPWHLAMIWRDGMVFIQRYLGFNVVGKVTGNYFAGTSSFFYILELQRQMLPWTFLIPFALLFSVHQHALRKFESFIILLVAITILLFFSFIPTRTESYLLPALPAVALLVADMIYRAFKDRSLSSLYSLALLFGAVLVVLRNPANGLIVFSVSGAALLLFMLLRKYRFVTITNTFAFFCFAIFAAQGFFHTNFEKRNLPSIAAKRIGEIQSSPKPLFTMFHYQSAVVEFYTDRQILNSFSVDEIERKINLNEEYEILLPAINYEQLSKKFDVAIVENIPPYIYATVQRRSPAPNPTDVDDLKP